jgi:hypothetical protein
MEVIDGIAVMRRISELNELAIQEHVDKLKRSNPSITEDEIKVEVQKWWLDKEEYWPEEFFRVGNPERFNQ